ncbi:serine/arginine repetitive matrix protein 2 [Drosophila subobscura]|uniref:serine/arginine repetitive matrix protein 2 n=1 Tax=Drosophila subobscura TaxID=7241 RepID=UPI00155B305B|nr:serine/arginine repetitive matrix protein 2 [Drosophila subobscura]
MVKSPWLREKNESQSPCQIENPMGLKESIQGSPSEDYFDIPEQHAQRHIKTEPHDEQKSVDFERDPFDELAELLEEENVPVYLVEMPLEAPPPPSISLPDDCFLFNRRAKVEIASPIASSSASISEHLTPKPNRSETALDPMHEVRVLSKSRTMSRRSSCSQQRKKSRRRRSRSGSSKERQCSPTRPARRNRNERKGDRATCSRKGSPKDSSSMETKRCNKSRGKIPGQRNRERVPSKSTSSTSDTNRDRTRSSNRACSSDREQFRKNMSYKRLSRRKFEENGNVFRRRRSRSGSSNRRSGHGHSVSPIRSPPRSRQEFSRYIRRYSPKRMSRWRCLSREPTESPSRSRSRQRCSRLRRRRHSRSRSRQHCRSREPAARHSSSRSRRHCRSREPVTRHSSRRPRQQCSREPPKRHSRSRSSFADNETRMRDTLSPVCSAMPNENLQASGFIHPSLGQAAPMAHNSPRPILPIITSRFGNPPPPHRHLPQMPGSVASNQMWYTQTHYTHFEYSTTTMQDGTSWQAPVYHCAGATHSALGPHDLRHRLGSTRSVPWGPHDHRHRIQGRTEYSSFPTEQEHMAPPSSTTTFGQTGYPSQYFTNGYFL